jgi:uncharacterized membrane protein
MLRKAQKADRGELTEPSVVQTPRARLFGNLPNALLGAIYYPALALGVSVAHSPTLLALALAAAAFAAATSLALAFSLLFVTRMPCPYCWMSHAVNWMLFAAVAQLFKLSYWR